jgi:penicillin-binding protein 1C
MTPDAACRPLVAVTVFCQMLIAAPAYSAPDFAAVHTRTQSSEGRLVDRHGELLHELRIDPNQRRLEWVALNDISPSLRQAVIRAEDQRFADHNGVDWHALFASLGSDGARGASTISMQLAARLDPTLQPSGRRRGWIEKWNQMQAARVLEKGWSKDQILEAYLNIINFRGELQGIAAASRGLFDKQPSGLDHIEALILTALIRSPNATPERVAERACALGLILRAPTDCPAITTRTDQVLRTPARLRPQVADAPHLARRLLKNRQANVITTLDARLQRYAHAVLAHQLDVIGAQRVSEGALLVVDNASGEVLAWVGGRGMSHVDAVRAPRQAGSTLKPFLYQLAIEKRLLTAASILDDSPLSLASSTGLYVPQNYEHDFKGFVSVRTSLGASLNIPAVRTATVVGADAFTSRLRELGFNYLVHDGDYYGFALALGSAEVTLEQLVNAYRTLANRGRSSPLSVTRAERSVERQVLDEGASFIVTDILADRSARSLTFGLENALATPFWSAVKTGTSKDMRDNWCIGFSERYTVGVWVGNFNGAPMQDVSGVTGAAPIWLDLMRYLHAQSTSRPPRVPSAVTQADIHFTPAIETSRRELFLRGTETGELRMPAVPPLAQARIRYPGRGSILAIDPDIPHEAQRVFFDVSPRDTPLKLELNGQKLADRDLGWAPQAGTHRLSLRTPDGALLDEVLFEVRGSYE